MHFEGLVAFIGGSVPCIYLCSRGVHRHFVYRNSLGAPYDGSKSTAVRGSVLLLRFAVHFEGGLSVCSARTEAGECGNFYVRADFATCHVCYGLWVCQSTQ